MNCTQRLEPDQEAMLVVGHLLMRTSFVIICILFSNYAHTHIYALTIIVLSAYQASLKALSGAVSSIDVIFHETLLSSVSSSLLLFPSLRLDLEYNYDEEFSYCQEIIRYLG